MSCQSFFFFLLLKAFITHYTFPCLTMIISYIIHTYIFSPSLLMTSCLGNIQWRWASTALISCCNSRFLNASCFSRHMVVQSTLHTSFESSLLFTLRAWDRVFFQIFCARSRVPGRSWACLRFLFFVTKNRIILSLFFLSLAKLATGFDLAPSKIIHRKLTNNHTKPPWLDVSYQS